MIVKELIEKLKQMPENKEVKFLTPNKTHIRIDKVYLNKMWDDVYLE